MVSSLDQKMKGVEVVCVLLKSAEVVVNMKKVLQSSFLTFHGQHFFFQYTTLPTFLGQKKVYMYIYHLQ